MAYSQKQLREQSRNIRIAIFAIIAFLILLTGTVYFLSQSTTNSNASTPSCVQLCGNIGTCIATCKSSGGSQAQCTVGCSNIAQCYASCNQWQNTHPQGGGYGGQGGQVAGSCRINSNCSNGKVCINGSCRWAGGVQGCPTRNPDGSCANKNGDKCPDGQIKCGDGCAWKGNCNL